MGLSAALYGAITLTNGRVDQANFNDYRILRINEMPDIQVYIIPGSDRPRIIGEAGLPPIAPALTNAIAAATGKRIRELPVSNRLQPG